MTSQKDDWYKFCRPYLEEFKYPKNVDPARYVKEVVERAVGFNADTIVYMADEGGYPVYPSKLTPMSDHLLGIDLFEMLEKEAHNRGLKFGAGFLGVHCNSYVRDEHPEWLQRDKKGNPHPFLASYIVCPNSPYGRYYAEYIREVLSRYNVDYIYVEGTYFVRSMCYCTYCREQFKAIYGKDLPEDSDSDEFHKFRQDSITRFLKRIRKVVDETSPGTVFVGCSYPLWTETSDVTTLREQADVVARENAWDHESPFEIGLRMLALKAEAKKDVLAATITPAKGVDTDYAPRSEAHLKLNFMMSMAYGATVQPHVQTLFEVDQTRMPTLAELFKCVKKVRPYLLNARLLPYAAILNWAGSKDVKDYLNPSLRGYYKSLIEHHVLFDLITTEDVEADRLGEYRVVVLPNATKLSDTVMEKISDYVRAGGGLVFTYRSGWFDEEGKIRSRMPLMELLGARCFGVGGPIKFPQGSPEARVNTALDLVYPIYYRVKSKEPIWDNLRERLLSYYGEYALVEAIATDCQVEAQIVDLDYSRMHKDHMTYGAYPGSSISPMILTRRIGKGRVAYIAGDLCASSHSIGNLETIEILAKIALWAAGTEPPVKTDCPPSVELITHSKRESLAIFLINQTTNYREKSETIRYVVQIKNVEIQVKTATPAKAVSTVTGQEAQYEHDDEWLKVKLDKLDEYEVVLIDV